MSFSSRFFVEGSLIIFYDCLVWGITKPFVLFEGVLSFDFIDSLPSFFWPNFKPIKSKKNIHWCWWNSLILIIVIISINFKAAHTRFNLLCYLIGSLKIFINKNIIICHKFANSLVSFYGLILRMRILKQKKIKIKTGWGASVFFITSIILSISSWAFSLYLSFLPAYKIKQILSKDLIFFLVYKL